MTSLRRSMIFSRLATEGVSPIWRAVKMAWLRMKYWSRALRPLAPGILSQ